MATFGTAAIRTFAHGVASLTDNSVVVQIRGDRAYTDGTTVVLPDRGIWKDGDFRAICGVACHEVSHVWFRSPAQLPGLYQKFPADAAGRVRRAFNVIVDIADETRFERAMPRAQALFAAAREHVLAQAIASNGLARTPPATVPEDQLLAVAILWVRAPAKSAVRRHLAAWVKRAAGLPEIVRLVTKAREAKGRPGTRFKPARTPRQWAKLTDLTAKLVELLDKLYPQQTGTDPNPSGAPGQSTGAPAGSPGFGCGGTGRDSDDVMAAWREAASAAGTARALTAASTGTIPDCFDWVPAADQWTDGAILIVAGGTGVPFRQDCYDRVWAAFKRVALDLATGPTMVREEGHLSGGRLTRPHRAAIDGRCFRRSGWEDGPDAAIAMVFDQSGSMGNVLEVFLPVGAALADALRLAPNVEVAVWRYGSAVERVARSADLRNGRTMGGTATHLAVKEAADWLAGKTARRRAVILFTDGQPDNVPGTSAAVIALRRSGAVLLVGSIGLSESMCARSMPGAVVFSVDPRDAGSSLHVAANRLRRMG